MFKSRLNYKFATKVPIHTKVCVLGGGTSGVSVVSQLCKEKNFFYHNIRVFEPNRNHFYQPSFTPIGGLFTKQIQYANQTSKLFNKQIPITEYEVQKIDPTNNLIITEDGQHYTYDQLVIATGNKLNFQNIKGLFIPILGAVEALNDSNCPVVSIYNFNYAMKTRNIASQFTGGKAIFTQPQQPIKCAGAPQKILFLLEDQWKQSNKQKNIEFHTALETIFGVQKYADALLKQHQEKNVQVNTMSNLVEVKGQEKIAIFKDLRTNELKEVKFDFLHLTPPQSAPEFIKLSGLGNQQGYVDVDPNTLQHNIYKNIWSLGDSSSCPTSKTAAAIFSQSPVLVRNLVQYSQNKNEPLKAHYDGYAACPIYVGGNKLILAEFKYNGITCETFWKSQDKPSRLLFLLKKYIFQLAYWNLLPRGLWYGKNIIFKPNY